MGNTIIEILLCQNRNGKIIQRFDEILNMINIDISKFNKYKVAYIIKLSESKILRDLCEEVWIFGSVVNGTSKVHSSCSDIDVAIMPKIKDLRSNETRKIHNEIRTLLTPIDKKSKHIARDIVWVLEDDDYMLTEIHKGVRII